MRRRWLPSFVLLCVVWPLVFTGLGAMLADYYGLVRRDDPRHLLRTLAIGGAWGIVAAWLGARDLFVVFSAEEPSEDPAFYVPILGALYGLVVAAIFLAFYTQDFLGLEAPGYLPAIAAAWSFFAVRSQVSESEPGSYIHGRGRGIVRLSVPRLPGSVRGPHRGARP